MGGGRGEGRDARTRGGMAWCGRGRGSGRNNGKEVDTEDMEVYEEDVDGSNRDSLRRKRDVSESGNSGTVAGKVQLLENGPARPPVSPQKEQDKKRPRTSETKGDNATKSSGSAPSEKEGDRKQ